MKRSLGSKVVRWLVVTALCALPVQGIAAQNGANSVNSAAIIIADGTSGQTLTTGNGIKTGHIQDGAVTDVKITGTISVEKLGLYANIKVVHKGLIDGVNSFNSISAALNSITDASQAKQYIVYIMPGDYSENVVMKDWVTIKGSGLTNTSITSSNPPVVLGANNNSAIEDISINSIGSNLPFTYALQLINSTTSVKNCYLSTINAVNPHVLEIEGGSTILENVTIYSSNSQGSVGVMLGSGASAQINNMKIKINDITLGYGLYAFNSKNVYVSNSSIDFVGYPDGFGVYADGVAYPNDGFLHINNSKIDGQIQTTLGIKTVAFSSSLLKTILPGTPPKLINCYDQAFNPIPNQ